MEIYTAIAALASGTREVKAGMYLGWQRLACSMHANEHMRPPHSQEGLRLARVRLQMHQVHICSRVPLLHSLHDLILIQHRPGVPDAGPAPYEADAKLRLRRGVLLRMHTGTLSPACNG